MHIGAVHSRLRSCRQCGPHGCDSAALPDD
jgi:hypothetical protein